VDCNDSGAADCSGVFRTNSCVSRHTIGKRDEDSLEKEVSGGNDGALFPNKNKERGDTRPHFTGNIEVDDVKYSLAAWKNLSKDGNPYMSLKLSEWRDRSEQAETRPAQVDVDDIPF